HFRLAYIALIESCGSAVLAIAQHEDNGSPLSVIGELFHRRVGRPPQRGWRIGSDRRRQGSSKLARIARERRTDDDIPAKGPDARNIVRAESREKLVGGRTQQRQVPLHAP